MANGIAKDTTERRKIRPVAGDAVQVETPRVKINMRREVGEAWRVYPWRRVSMVLSNNPRISRPTQLRVRQIIDQVGYRPNRLAQSLSGQYTNVLAILVPALRHAFADAYFGELISGITDRAHKMQMKLMLEVAKPDFIRRRRPPHGTLRAAAFVRRDSSPWGSTIGCTRLLRNLRQPAVNPMVSRQQLF